MTRPGSSALVLDGSEVKLRLIAERKRTRSPVHVDWVRFTTARRNAVAPGVDLLFPAGGTDLELAGNGALYKPAALRQAEIARVLASLHDGEFAAAAEAQELAQRVCQALGEGYQVATDLRKGHDFYKYRWAITRNDAEVGWVGFLSSGESPRQQAQAATLHVNVFGSACTFADEGWRLRLADLIDQVHGDLTRCDLAADFFEGLPYDLDELKPQYLAGVMDVHGKRPKCSMAGDWANGHERSFYLGSREAGKQTNVYEKGDQLFGREAGSAWVRIELRYGNKLRVLSSDMLRRPADFFAGASEWHARQLAHIDLAEGVEPEKVKTRGRLAIETVKAEVTRNLRWALQTAGPTIAAAWQFLGDEFLSLVETPKRPGRLQRLKDEELAAVYPAVMNGFFTATGPRPACAMPSM